MTDSAPSNFNSDPQMAELLRSLELETEAALERVYQLDQPTPLDLSLIHI